MEKINKEKIKFEKKRDKISKEDDPLSSNDSIGPIEDSKNQEEEEIHSEKIIEEQIKFNILANYLGVFKLKINLGFLKS